MEEEAAKLKEMQKDAEDSLLSPTHGGNSIYISLFIRWFSLKKIIDLRCKQQIFGFERFPNFDVSRVLHSLVPSALHKVYWIILYKRWKLVTRLFCIFLYGHSLKI